MTAADGPIISEGIPSIVIVLVIGGLLWREPVPFNTGAASNMAVGGLSI